MPPKYSNNTYRNSNNRNTHHHTPSTTPVISTPSSGAPITNKSSTQTSTDPSRIIPQPRRRRSSVNREQSSPSSDSDHTTSTTTSTINNNNTTNGGSNNNLTSVGHHTTNSTSNNNNTTSSHNILDDDCENQAGLATNAIEKIFSTTLQFNSESILSAVDLLQQRRESQFPNEKRKRFTIREILEVGTSNPVCNERHNDLPELDYRKLDWGITPLPTKTLELTKRPTRQQSSTQQESPFGGSLRGPFSGRGRSHSRENNSGPTTALSPNTSTISALSSRFATSAIANSSSTVMRTSGKGALWFDEPVIEESNPLELTNEEVERKKAFEEFRKIHHATVGAGTFFDFGAVEGGELLEGGLSGGFDEELGGDSLEPTSLDEMGGSSSASELESYFNTLSSTGNNYGTNFIGDYPKEQTLNEIEDEFISLPTPKSMLAPQQRDKPLFGLVDTLKPEPTKPVHKEDSVISSVLHNKSGKSRFGFGDGLESDMKQETQHPQQNLPFSNNNGTSKFANINQQAGLKNTEDQTILPIHHHSHTGGGATINVTALFGNASHTSVNLNRKINQPMQQEVFNNYPTSMEKSIEEEHAISQNIHLEQFPVIDSSNQISMMSAEDLELQFLKSLNDTNQPMVSIPVHAHENISLPLGTDPNKMGHLFKPISNEQNIGVQEVTSQLSSQFVSPFQRYQEQKQNEKSETKATEDMSPSKPTIPKTTTASSPASTTQRKLSKTSANSPFVPSHLMKKMGTNTEKKIKLKVNTPVSNNATSKTTQSNTATNNTSTTTTNVASVPQTVETQQTIVNQPMSVIPQNNEFLPQNNMVHMNPNQLHPPTGSQHPVSTNMPMNMGMPISPLMNQNQPPIRILQKPPTGFVPSQPYPNSPTFIPFSPQGQMPVHPGIPSGFMPPNGNMFPSGFMPPNNGMFPPHGHPNMFMGNQDFSQALSLEDLEKELMNHK